MPLPVSKPPAPSRDVLGAFWMAAFVMRRGRISRRFRGDPTGLSLVAGGVARSRSVLERWFELRPKAMQLLLGAGHDSPLFM